MCVGVFYVNRKTTKYPGKWSSAHWAHYKMLPREKLIMGKCSKQPQKAVVGLRAFKDHIKETGTSILASIKSQ